MLSVPLKAFACGQMRPPSVNGANDFASRNNDRVTAVPSRESDDVIALRSAHFQRLIVSVCEDIGKLGAELQEMPGPRQLKAAIGPIPHELRPIRRLQRSECRRARGKIDRPAVVGIDEGKVPQLGALVKVRHPRQRGLQGDLAQRIQRAQQRDALRQRLQRIEEFSRARGIENSFDEALQPGLVSLVGIEPAGFLLALPCSLQRVGLHPLGECLVVRLPGP